jgi:hypothetical protein
LIAVFIAGGCAKTGGGAQAVATSGSSTSGSGGGGGAGGEGGAGGGCPAGYADCDGLPENGCEVFTVTHASHCGACGNKCSTANHAGAACAESKCQLACNSGYRDCNTKPEDGCEASLLNDPKNCGECGQVCANECTIGVCKPTVIADKQPHPADLAIDADYVYWVNVGMTVSDDGSVVRAPKKGGKVEEIAKGQLTPWSIAVDATNVYWTNYGDLNTKKSDGGVYSAPKAGGSTTVLAQGQLSTGSIAVDATHAYFASAGSEAKGYTDGEIRKVPLKGGNAVVVATAQLSPNDLAVVGDYLYWVNLGSKGNNYLDGSLWRISLKDAQPTPTKLADKLLYPNRLDLDPQHVFLAASTAPGIFKVKLDDQKLTLVVSPQKIYPYTIALSPTDIYFGATDDLKKGSVHRVSKVGGTPLKLAAMDRVPYGLAVDESRIYWADADLDTFDNPTGVIYATTK